MNSNSSEQNVVGGRLFTYGEVARRLDVPSNTISVAVRRQRIATVGSHHTARITEAELRKWEDRFNRLNSAFDWLQPILEAPGTKIKVVNAHAAARHLGVSAGNLTPWCQEGLLPFFVRSFTFGSTAGNKDRRALVQVYLRGLLGFVGNIKPVRKSTARRYSELCRGNKKIM